MYHIAWPCRGALAACWANSCFHSSWFEPFEPLQLLGPSNISQEFYRVLKSLREPIIYPVYPGLTWSCPHAWSYNVIHGSSGSIKQIKKIKLGYSYGNCTL